MYKLDGVPNINNYTNDPKRKIPKSLILFFIFVTFIFGMDFGVTELMNKKLRLITKIISKLQFLLVLATFIVSLYETEHKDFYYIVLVPFQYVLYCYVLIIAKYTLCNFIIDIYSIENVKRLYKKRIGLIIWLYFMTIALSKLIILYIYCETFKEICHEFKYLPALMYCMSYLCVDTCPIVLFLIYQLIYYCVRNLNEKLKKGCSIQELKKQYIKLANCYDNILPLYNRLIFCEILLEVPKMMGLFWMMLKVMQDNLGWFAVISEAIYAIQTAIFILSSAAMVQLTAFQVDALKLQLHNILISEENAKNHEQASRLLQYMEARRLQHDVLGVLPVDMRLPASVLSVCTTYMIVIVQFTHLYD